MADRNHSRKERGIATVELALILPVLLLVLFGAVHFAGLFFLENQMINAARDAARRLTVDEITAGQAETAIETALGSWPTTFTVDITMPDPSNPSDRDIVVNVTTPIADAGLVDFLTGLTPGDLEAEVTMRLE